MDTGTSTMPRRADSLLREAGAGRGRIGEFATAALLLFASGVAALIFQVLWIKQLSLVVGVEVYAITVAVSAFFGGLALGGLVLGRWADRMDRPVRFYAWLEVGIAVLGVAMTLALARVAPLFATMEATSSLLAWAMVFVIVGIPAFLMGERCRHWCAPLAPVQAASAIPAATSMPPTPPALSPARCSRHSFLFPLSACRGRRLPPPC